MYHNIPDARLLDILNKLGLDKFANTQALDTMIVENGANLSGGEPQISDSANESFTVSEEYTGDRPGVRWEIILRDMAGKEIKEVVEW